MGGSDFTKGNAMPACFRKQGTRTAVVFSTRGTVTANEGEGRELWGGKDQEKKKTATGGENLRNVTPVSA